MKILFTGGGTGGHIFPIIAIIREIKKIYPKEDLQIRFMGSGDEWSLSFLSQEGINVKTVLAGKIRRYFSIKSFFQNIIDIFFKIPLGILKASFYVFFWSPDLIFSKGGFGSIPVVFSGWLLQVPIFLHESDKAPGLTNRILEKLCLEIFTSFPKTESLPEGKIILVGNPIREELLENLTEDPREFFGIKSEKPVILILGGSQGAQRINDIILQVLAEILVSFDVIHQIGPKNFEQLKKEVKVMVPQKLQDFYHPFPFLKEKELILAYRTANLIISRGGAGILFEIAALGKPSILIPLPEAAQNHQLKNAYAFAKNGAAVVIEETNFTPHFFLEQLRFLLSRPEKLEKMGQKAREFAKPQAARIIAEYIIGYLKT